MKAIILAGGLGKRLGELTKTMPKPLVKIGNKSVIEHIVDNLIESGITQIIVKVHYLPDQIMQVVGEKVIYYYEPILYPHLTTLKHLRNWLEGEPFLVINGDTINDVNYEMMIKEYDGYSIMELVDEWRCAGSWIYPKDYYTNHKLFITPYRPKMTWFDIGTMERLEEARKHFEV